MLEIAIIIAIMTIIFSWVIKILIPSSDPPIFEFLVVHNSVEMLASLLTWSGVLIKWGYKSSDCSTGVKEFEGHV